MNYAVIMAGGAGTRLWPISRERLPKPALRLYSEKSMFQIAVARLAPLFTPQQVIVVAGAAHSAVLAEQVPEIPRENFILEPEGRGTASAIALTAVHLAARDPEAVMAVLTADHFIGNETAFREAVAAALKAAKSDRLVTLGISPEFPSTEYGYIQQGDLVDEIEGFRVLEARRFVEKPDQERAAEMVRSGNYAWNSGMFIWKVSVILEEFARQMPELYDQINAIGKSINTPAYDETLAEIWPKIRKQTIDYGIMEGARGVVVLPVTMQWTDVGNWNSLKSLLPVDARGNTVRGDSLLMDCSGTLVLGGQKLIAGIGLEDLIVVDTPDALLICRKDRVQDVRKVAEELKAAGRLDLI
ncbi:MAG: mannose-1-phosphate guanylyltransferase [Anaerolineaceae bacterium]